jgi:hypothetical protein
MATKSTKFYSLDECETQDKVLAKLDILTDDRKIDYDFVEADLIKIKDISLTLKEIKELNQFLHDNDVIEDKDYEDEEEDEDDEDNYDDDDY